MDWDETPERHVEPLTEEQLAFMTEQTRHAASKGVASGLKRWSIGAAVVYVVIVGAVWLALKDGQDSLRAGLQGSCERVNVLRAQSNGSDLVSFKILSISGQRESALAKTTTGVESKTHRISAFGLWDQATHLRVTKLTDCRHAVDDPAHYKTPVAGPIGDPHTGELSPGVKKVVDASNVYLKNRGE